MQTYELVATNASDDTDNDSLSVSFGNNDPNTWVAIQRFTDSKTIYLAFDDQSNGDYDSISSARISPDHFDIRLNTPIGQTRLCERIRIDLKSIGDEYPAISARLAQLFAGTSVDFSQG